MTVERAIKILAMENRKRRKDPKDVIEARRMGIEALKLQGLISIWLCIEEPTEEGAVENETD